MSSFTISLGESTQDVSIEEIFNSSGLPGPNVDSIFKNGNNWKDNISIKQNNPENLTTNSYCGLPAGGIFDGQNNTITLPSNLGIDGLFTHSSFSNFTVQNLGVIGGFANTSGGFIIRQKTFSFTVNNCYSTGNIGGDAGGICAASVANGGGICYINNCYSTGNIGRQGGGICGGAPADGGGKCYIKNCYSTGQIGINAGGICGYYAGRSGGYCEIENCYSSGNIMDEGGGICGSSCCWSDGSCKIINCFSTGNHVPRFSGDQPNKSGGICGSFAGTRNGNCVIENCFSTGNIGQNGGGICGYFAGAENSGFCQINNCYSTGFVGSGGGSICGQLTGSNGACLIQNCYSTGSGSNNLCGDATDNTYIYNCYSNGGKLVGSIVNNGSIYYNTDLSPENALTSTSIIPELSLADITSNINLDNQVENITLIIGKNNYTINKWEVENTWLAPQDETVNDIYPRLRPFLNDTVWNTANNINYQSISSLKDFSVEPLLFNFVANDNQLTINAFGGIAPYTYSLNNGTYNESNILTVNTNIVNTVYVKDSTDKIFSRSIDLKSLGPAELNIRTTVTNITCNGSFNGSITATGLGGNPPYQFKLNDLPLQNSGLFSNLSSGSYNITVSDSTGATKSTSASISQPLALLINLDSKSDLTTSTSNDGVITVSASGGTSPYSFSKDGGKTYQNNGIFNNLKSGIYSILVKDANNCTNQLTNIQISRPRIEKIVVNYSDTYSNQNAKPQYMELAGINNPTSILSNSRNPTNNILTSSSLVFTIPQTLLSKIKNPSQTPQLTITKQINLPAPNDIDIKLYKPTASATTLILPAFNNQQFPIVYKYNNQILENLTPTSATNYTILLSMLPQYTLDLTEAPTVDIIYQIGERSNFSKILEYSTNLRFGSITITRKLQTPVKLFNQTLNSVNLLPQFDSNDVEVIYLRRRLTESGVIYEPFPLNLNSNFANNIEASKFYLGTPGNYKNPGTYTVYYYYPRIAENYNWAQLGSLTQPLTIKLTITLLLPDNYSSVTVVRRNNTVTSNIPYIINSRLPQKTPLGLDIVYLAPPQAGSTKYTEFAPNSPFGIANNIAASNFYLRSNAPTSSNVFYRIPKFSIGRNNQAYNAVEDPDVFGRPPSFTLNIIPNVTTANYLRPILNGNFILGSDISPYSGNFGGTKKQYLYTATEIKTASDVTIPNVTNPLGLRRIMSVGFNVQSRNSCPVLKNFSIRIYRTTVTNYLNTSGFTIMPTETLLSSTATTDYTLPAQTGSTPYWTEHNLLTPIEWNGTDNLIVEVCFNNGNDTANGTATVIGSNFSGVNRTIYYNDNNLNDICNQQWIRNFSSYIPNIRFRFE